MNILKRISGTISWMSEKGIPTEQVPAEILLERLAICKNCPDNKFMNLTRQCKVCMCFMDVKARIVYDPIKSAKEGELVKTVCPLNHWPEFNFSQRKNESS